MEDVSQDKLPLAVAAPTDILLVEDDPNDAELTMRALQQFPRAMRVEHVTGGAEALEYFEAANLFVSKGSVSFPKLILLDLKLQDVGGLHVLRRLKSEERTRAIPITVLTSSKLVIELVESYQLGVNSYVVKPTDAEEFARVIGQIAHYWLEINQPPP